MKKYIILLVIIISVLAGILLTVQNKSKTESSSSQSNSSTLPSSVTAKYDEIKANIPEGHPFLGTIELCSKDSERIYKVTTSSLNGTSYYYQDDGDYAGQYEFSDIDVPGQPQQRPPVDTSTYSCTQVTR